MTGDLGTTDDHKCKHKGNRAMQLMTTQVNIRAICFSLTWISKACCTHLLNPPPPPPTRHFPFVLTRSWFHCQAWNCWGRELKQHKRAQSSAPKTNSTEGISHRQANFSSKLIMYNATHQKRKEQRLLNQLSGGIILTTRARH